MARGREDKKRVKVVFILPDQYRIELENGENSGIYEPVATKRLAANCSFDSLSEDNVVFNNNGSALIADDHLDISINNASATIRVYRTTGRVEVTYP